MKNEEHKFDEINVKEAQRLTENKLKDIGKEVRRLRTENGLSLNDVAFYSYSSVDSLYRIENGRANNITLLTLIKLSTFFQKDLF